METFCKIRLKSNLLVWDSPFVLNRICDGSSLRNAEHPEQDGFIDILVPL